MPTAASTARYIGRAAADLHKKIIKYRKASVSDKSRATESLAEHRAVLDAISRGDCALAEELTVTHIRNAMQHIIEN